MKRAPDDATECEVMAWALTVVLEERLDELVELLAEEGIDALKVVEIVRRFVEDAEREDLAKI